MRQLLTLFWSFFKIGLFTFGGGYAMIPLIRREVIDRRGWIAEPEFLDLLTLAQSAPGPISLNTSVFVGYKMRGYAGAVAAILGVVVPSFVIILLIALLFADIRTNPVVDAAFKGMRPAVVALIIVPVISLAKGMHPAMYAVIALTAVAVWHLGWSPVWILAGAAAAGILHALYRLRKEGRR
ncbi:MAG: chromate transporter [Alistipes senegalensis]|nr:chromate transporter [Bacteroides cellulosilyticus]MCM1351916.1 chromate transporter [Alistipes senegalensis]